jgi:hypothetical protein
MITHSYRHIRIILPSQHFVRNREKKIIVCTMQNSNRFQVLRILYVAIKLYLEDLQRYHKCYYLNSDLIKGYINPI